MDPLVTVITPTTGNPLLEAALESVARQTYQPIQHLVIIDGSERSPAARRLISTRSIDVIELPYPTGLDGFQGHRIYGAAPYLARGDLICFLDEGTTGWTRSMLKAWSTYCAKAINGPSPCARLWTRKAFICLDNCESLGKWPSILSPDDYLVDVNCFMLSKQLAVNVSPICHRKFRQPGVLEIDRMFVRVLRLNAPRLNQVTFIR